MPSRTERYARCLKISGLLLMLIAGYGCQSASSDNPQHCFEQSGQAFSEVLNCYRKAEATQPLRYISKGQEQQPGVNIRRFELRSQSWGQRGQVAPADWIHRVDLYIPDNVKGTRAVLVTNDGVNNPLPGESAVAPNNFSQQTLLNIARQTGLIVVAVSNVPNQYLTYGGNWPLAYIGYYLQGVIAQRKTEPFKKLMQVEDPMTYRNLPGYTDRLKIPKYIVNASGDDFFIPDASRQYLADLPGDNTLRVIPNSADDVRAFVEANLIPYIKRRQTGNTAPRLKAQEQRLDATSTKLHLTLSEIPIRMTQWTAHNPKARDFRYNCGVRYTAAQLPASMDVQTTLRAPKVGWAAEFFEAEYADGVVETTMVKVLPDTYPNQAPPADEAFCRTLPATLGQ